LTPSPALLFNVKFIDSLILKHEISKKTSFVLTPTQSAVALMMIIPGDIASLIDFFSFTAWIFYGAAMPALIVMRFTKKDAPRPYKVQLQLSGMSI
jgi:hypothetical protein